MAMRGALQLSRRTLGKTIELPEFTKSRFARRYNLMDEDRVKWYNWNLACILLTAIPPLWMFSVVQYCFPCFLVVGPSHGLVRDWETMVRCLWKVFEMQYIASRVAIKHENRFSWKSLLRHRNRFSWKKQGLAISTKRSTRQKQTSVGGNHEGTRLAFWEW